MQQTKWILKKQDAVTLFLLVVIGILISIFIWLPGKSPGSFLEIQQNGKVVKTLPLTEDHSETITSENGGKNTFTIQNGTVSMREANCGDHTCIRTGSISKSGESIVCLPHRLIFRITKDETKPDSSEPDAIVH